jgi:transcriptional regulator with XRE-family HTH domain
MSTESFGTILRRLREAKGMSQQALADAIGIAQMSVSFYEQDKHEPGWNAVVKICQALGEPCAIFQNALAGTEAPATEKRGRGRPPKEEVPAPAKKVPGRKKG